MNWDAIAAVGEMMGAAGVILSLIYLALQIRKSDQTASSEAIRTVLDGPRDRVFLQGYSDRELATLLADGLNDLDNLDLVDQRRLFWYLSEQLFQMQQVMELYSRKLLSKLDYDAWVFYTASLFRTPGGEKIWPQLEAVITPNIINLVNKHLAACPDQPSFLELVPLFKNEVASKPE